MHSVWSHCNNGSHAYEVITKNFLGCLKKYAKQDVAYPIELSVLECQALLFFSTVVCRLCLTQVRILQKDMPQPSSQLSCDQTMTQVKILDYKPYLCLGL